MPEPAPIVANHANAAGRPGPVVSSRHGSVLSHPAVRRWREAATGYAQLSAGVLGRIVLQAVYFLVLAGTLTLPDMGVFASASAAGILLGCFAGFGFSSCALHAAAGRPRTLGAYMAVFYAGLLASLPLSLIAGAALYALLFADLIEPTAFLAIIVVETFLWRLSEVVHQLNNFLGRYGAASWSLVIASAARTIAALAFAAAGGGSVETWSVVYLAANGLAAAAVLALYRPRVRLRWRPRLIGGRLKEALLFALSSFAFYAQGEVDKLVVLTVAGERAAGIYAISIRLVDFAAVPMRTFFVFYIRRLIGERRPIDVLRRGLTLEAVTASVSTACFLVLLGALWIHPTLLGANVAASAPLFAAMLAVPAFKILLEFHAELFFAYGRMTARAVALAALVALKAAALVLLLTLVPGLPEWGASLNAVYGGLYLVSAIAVYRTVSTGARR